jgi:hypothetical protein
VHPRDRGLPQDGLPLPHARRLGCGDGDHKARIIADLKDKEEARMIVPPDFRAQARIVRLTSFTLEQIEAMRRRHNARQDPGTA